MSNKEYISISFYFSRVLFLGGLFSLLFNVSLNSILISSIFGILLGYILLYLFYKKGNINKYMKIILAICIIFINILGNTILTNNYLLIKTPVILIILLFLLICIYGSKDIKTISRVSFILLYISLFIMLFAMLGLYKRIDISNYNNMFNNNIIKGIVLFCVSSLSPNLLLLEYKDNKSFNTVSYGYIMGCVSNILVIFFILGIYNAKLASSLRFVEYLVLKNVNLFDFLSNIENILILEWLFTIMLSGMYMINIIKKYSNNYFLYFILFIIVISIYILLHLDYSIIMFIKNYIYYVFIGIIIISYIIKK